MVKPLPEGTVLNLGAGPRSPQRSRTNFIGVDLVTPPTTPEGAFVVGDAAHLPFATATFDGALCKDIVEHTVDPIGVLREVRRVCAPGAVMVVTVPRAIPRAVWADPTHVRGFTAAALTTALNAAGWRVTQPPRRIGGLPGAGRLGLEAHLLTIMRVPGLGHWFGTNWYVVASR